MSNALKKLAIGLTALTAFNTANADDVQKQTEYKPFSSPISTQQAKIAEHCGVPSPEMPLSLTINDFISATPETRQDLIQNLKEADRRYVSCALHVVDHLQR